MCKCICAIIPRVLFILLSLDSIFGVTQEKGDDKYWLLTILLLPLVVEMIITLKIRKGRDYKWFSPPIFLFLISIIPSMWIMELQHQDYKATNSWCQRFDSSDNVCGMNTLNEIWVNITYKELKGLSKNCSKHRGLVVHQMMLLVLILGKWLLPVGGGLTREALSQLLLNFVGTAADILEFTSETVSDVKEDSYKLLYIVLAVWTWSMLQFPLHLAVVTSKPDNEGKQEAGEVSLLSERSMDIWIIMEALFIQDGPFFVVRIIAMTCFNVLHHSLLFFTVKNFLVVILNLYRLFAICQDWRSRDGRGSAVP